MSLSLGEEQALRVLEKKMLRRKYIGNCEGRCKRKQVNIQ